MRYIEEVEAKIAAHNAELNAAKITKRGIDVNGLQCQEILNLLRQNRGKLSKKGLLAKLKAAAVDPAHVEQKVIEFAFKHYLRALEAANLIKTEKLKGDEENIILLEPAPSFDVGDDDEGEDTEA